MKFSYKQGERIEGGLSYIDEDKAIDFVPSDEIYQPSRHGLSAALVVDKTLQVEFLIDSGRLLYVWGYLPQESWKEREGRYDLEGVVSGQVFVHDVDDPVSPGAGYGTDVTLPIK
jgi:hypothetical protein